MNQLRKELLDLYSDSFLKRVYTFLKMLIVPIEDFSKLLPKEGMLLDIGSGYGHMSNFFSIESKNRQVIGIDTDSKRISVAKKTICGRTNIDFICGDIRELTDIDKVDMVIMADVLHHIPFDKHKEFLRCLYNKLKNGGIFLIRETNKKKSLKYYLMNYFWEVTLYPFSEKCNFYSAKQLKVVLEQTGFKIIEEIMSSPWSAFETVVYASKK